MSTKITDIVLFSTVEYLGTSFAVNTNHTNNTDKPFMLYVYNFETVTHYLNIWVFEGETYGDENKVCSIKNDASKQITGSALVPPHYNYRVYATNNNVDRAYKIC